MRFGSVCSGIEAASVAWHRLGWQASWFAEIEPFPCAALAHHYPDVPNLGDMTAISARVLAGAVEAPDILVGGTPCQAFSVAGMRHGLSDARGALTLKYVELANAIDHVRGRRGEQPALIVWENVPGVLSSQDNAFGCFLGALAGSRCELHPSGGRWADAGCVYGPKRAIAWRVLDAQYFGLAQRRRRVFVVASAGAGTDPASVLFERDGLRRDSAPRRKSGKGTAGGAEEGASVRGNDRGVAPTLDATMDRKWGSHQWVNSGFAILEPVVMAHGQANAEIRADGGTPALTCLHEAPVVALPNTKVRRLTPRECERLQGFPDDYTAIPWRGKPADQCPDGPRYKALGNSMAVPVMRWIGERIKAATGGQEAA